jgi:hypothetical protein
MIADQLAKFIRQALVTRGFKGQIPMAEAREIRSNLLRDINKKGHKQRITIELALSYLNGETMCDCAKTKIIVEPAITKQVHVKR